MSDLVLSTDNVENSVSVTAILVWSTSLTSVLEHRVKLPEDGTVRTTKRLGGGEEQTEWSVAEKAEHAVGHLIMQRSNENAQRG